MHPVLRFGAAAVVAAGLCGITSPAQAEDRLSVGFGFGPFDFSHMRLRLLDVALATRSAYRILGQRQRWFG